MHIMSKLVHHCIFSLPLQSLSRQFQIPCAVHIQRCLHAQEHAHFLCNYVSGKVVRNNLLLKLLLPMTTIFKGKGQAVSPQVAELLVYFSFVLSLACPIDSVHFGYREHHKSLKPGNRERVRRFQMILCCSFWEVLFQLSQILQSLNK